MEAGLGPEALRGSKALDGPSLTQHIECTSTYPFFASQTRRGRGLPRELHHLQAEIRFSAAKRSGKRRDF